MRYRASMLAAALALWSIPAFAMHIQTIHLHAQHDSGENGKATLTQQGRDVVVAITVTMKPGSPPELAHIHSGTCEKLGSRTPYELEPVVNGKSKTTLKGVSMSAFGNGLYSIVIHRTMAQVSTHVSCGGPIQPKGFKSHDQ